MSALMKDGRDTVLRRVLAVVGLAALGLVGFYMACYYWPPKVKIRCRRDEAGRLLVDVKPNFRVNSISITLFWCPGDDRYLWAVNPYVWGVTPEDAEFRHIVYGVVPGGAKQMYPPGGASPKGIPAGSVFCVGVSYQYDRWISACSGAEDAKFRLLADGTVEYLGKPTPQDMLSHPVSGGRFIFGPGYNWPNWVDPEVEQALATMVEQVIEQNPAAVRDYVGGKEEAFRTLKDRLERVDSDFYYWADRELAPKMLRARLDAMKPQAAGTDDGDRAQD
jgi:hypothetical protein